MNPQNQSISKRENFRISIRRRQVDLLFSECRKNFMSEASGESSPLSPNDELMKRSLQKNELTGHIPQILPMLRHKAKHNSTKINDVEFVAVIASNLLKDEITLAETEQLYSLCMSQIGLGTLTKMSPVVEVYLYETLFARCYPALDEPPREQLQIEVIPRLMALLALQDLALDRVPQSYSLLQIKQEVYEGVLSSLKCYFQPENDHNKVLYYKIGRQLGVLETVAQWWMGASVEALGLGRNVEIVESLMALWANVTSSAYPLMAKLGKQASQALLDQLLQILCLQSEAFTTSKTLCIQTLLQLSQQSPSPMLPLPTPTLNHLLDQLSNTPSLEYTTLLLKFSAFLFQNHNLFALPQLHNFTLNLLSIIVEMLAKQEEHTDERVLRAALGAVRAALRLGLEQGLGEFRVQWEAGGGARLLDGLYVKLKGQHQQQLMDDIYLCIDLY